MGVAGAQTDRARCYAVLTQLFSIYRALSARLIELIDGFGFALPELAYPIRSVSMITYIFYPPIYHRSLGLGSGPSIVVGVEWGRS